MPNTFHRRFCFKTLCPAVMLLAALVPAQAAPRPAARAPLSRPVSAPLPFLTGADLSALPFQESRGVRYFDGAGPQDLLAIARQNHWTVVRVRLWVHPASSPDASVSGLPAVSLLGRRIKAAGLMFLLDIHYSDTWADPGHQAKPAAWDSLPFPQLVHQVHDYTRDAVAHLRAHGAPPDMVQVGNETRNGLLYRTDGEGAAAQPGGGFWEPDGQGMGRAARLLAAGLAGVRDGGGAKPPLTILHIPDGQDPQFVQWYFTTLQAHGEALEPPALLRYDMVGLSYYPVSYLSPKDSYEGRYLSHLSQSMNFAATVLHKPVLIVETNWPQAGTPPAASGAPEFAFTPRGQAQFYHALAQAVRAVPNGLGRGVLAWETDALNWDSVFDAGGHALPAARALGQP